MQKVLLYLFLFTMMSCKPEVIHQNGFNKATNAEFPIIIDLNQKLPITKSGEKWLQYHNHKIRYLGKPKDTIETKGYIFKLRPIKALTNSKDYNFKPGPYHDYFFFFYELLEQPKKIVSNDSTPLKIEFDTTQTINHYGYESFPVIITNTSNDTVFLGNNNRIDLITEAKIGFGQWLPIEVKLDYMCGNGIEFFVLPPNEIALTTQLIYDGNYKTDLRLKLGCSYSPVFHGKINLSQLIQEKR